MRQEYGTLTVHAYALNPLWQVFLDGGACPVCQGDFPAGVLASLRAAHLKAHPEAWIEVLPLPLLSVGILAAMKPHHPHGYHRN